MEWGELQGFIEDATRSGKTKRRGAFSQGKRTYSISMNLKYDEYLSFRTWYNDTIKRGVYSFGYPNVDKAGHDTTDIVEYRFASGGVPRYTNPSGKIIKVTMVWEKV